MMKNGNRGEKNNVSLQWLLMHRISWTIDQNKAVVIEFRKGKLAYWYLLMLQKWTNYECVHITFVKLRSVWTAISKGSCEAQDLIKFLVTLAFDAQLSSLLSNEWQALVRVLWGSLVRSVKLLTVSLWLLEPSLSKNIDFSSNLRKTKKKLLNITIDLKPNKRAPQRYDPLDLQLLFHWYLQNYHLLNYY
jgi:hypothetical protein